MTAVSERTEVAFDTSPERYRHWRLDVDGRVATLTLAVDPDGGLVPGYELKMNSYDLGVDIELHDAVQRLRFEHPQVAAVVVTGGPDRMFCAGANIKMLAASSHAWKVSFCKFTNETRNGIEDATAHSGQTWIAALNGTAAGGGYELALACDQIVLVDDGSSAVSLPEVPLLGVLPGTGGGRGWWYDAAAFLALSHETVWIELSGLPPKRLPTYYANHDLARLARRFVFGTDWPGVPGVAANARAVAGLGLPEGTVALALGGNAVGIYHGLVAGEGL